MISSLLEHENSINDQGIKEKSVNEKKASNIIDIFHFSYCFFFNPLIDSVLLFGKTNKVELAKMAIKFILYSLTVIPGKK